MQPLLHWTLLNRASPRFVISPLGGGFNTIPSCSGYTKSTCTTTYPSYTRSEYSSFCFGNTRPIATTSILPPRLITSVHVVGSVRRSITFGYGIPPSPSNCALQTASKAEAQLLCQPPTEVGLLEGDLKGTPCSRSMPMISLVTFAITLVSLGF